MTEKFNREYRRFAEAARDAASEKNRRKKTGFANPEYRKSVGRDPSIVLEGDSDELKDKISPETLVSFLKVLGGGEVAHRQILDVGHFLSKHRTELHDRIERPYQPLAPEDRRLVDLACSLIEGAFYQGHFLQVSKQQRAALAFIANTIAKIFEHPKSSEGLRGFDRQKVERFIDAVHDFEQRELFPGVKARKGEPSVSERALFDLGEEINTRRRVMGANNPNVRALERTYEYLMLADRYFTRGEVRSRRLLNVQYILPYLLKNVLIVDDRIKSEADEQKRNALETDLAIARFPDDWKKKMENGVSEHSMVSSDNSTSKYGIFHMIDVDMPFSVWALRYLRSQAHMKNSPTK